MSEPAAVWVECADRLPPYGLWTILECDRGEVWPGYRSHTNAQGEHYRGCYQVAHDSDSLPAAIRWLDWKPPKMVQS